MTSAVIRPATPADAAAIASIYNHYVANSVITFEEEAVTAPAMAQRIADIQALDLPWLVAQREDEVVGYSYANRWTARSAYRHSVESTIYLRPGFEGRGLGKGLYTALIDILKTKRMHAVIGGAALPNPASAALHEGLGFAHVGTFREVGFKHGRWVDVAYWQLLLS
jgi:phosphinothricin acetyltransferase